jgi:hypothetical protein
MPSPGVENELREYGIFHSKHTQYGLSAGPHARLPAISVLSSMLGSSARAKVRL